MLENIQISMLINNYWNNKKLEVLLETYKNEDKIIRTYEVTAKAILSWKFIVIQSYLRKKKKFKKINLGARAIAQREGCLTCTQLS